MNRLQAAALALALMISSSPVRAAEQAVPPKARTLAATTVRLGVSPVTVQLLDARSYFNDLHKLHLGHPGIPTHRLLFSADNGKSLALKQVNVVGPKGKIQAFLHLEAKSQVADVELRAPGAYTFEIMASNGAIARWKRTIR